MDEQTVRALVEEHYANAGVNEQKVEEIYTDDVIVEFPQSGEQFRGKANVHGFRAAFPQQVRIKPWRTTGSGDVWVNEGRITYDGGAPMNTVSIWRFRGDKVVHETVYVTESWEAPQWRAPWAEKMEGI
ncbi:MAG: nuclear transport factor 2 family protein [Actinomycetota bacterium]